MWLVPGGGPAEWPKTVFALDRSVAGGEQRMLLVRQNQLFQLRLDGQLLPVAGNGEPGDGTVGSGDGQPALDVALSGISDVVPLPTGELLIVETTGWFFSGRVRIVRRDQTIDTLLDSRRPIQTKDGRSVRILPRSVAAAGDRGEILVLGEERGAEKYPDEDQTLDTLDWDNLPDSPKAEMKVWRLRTGAVSSVEALVGGGGSQVGEVSQPGLEIALEDPGRITATPDGGLLLRDGKRILKAQRLDGVFQVRDLGVPRGFQSIHDIAVGSTGNVVFSTDRGLWELVDPVAVPLAGSDQRFGVNAEHGRCDRVRVARPTSITPAPGGGFFFLDGIHRTEDPEFHFLKFVAPDDELEDQLVRLVRQVKRGVEEGKPDLFEPAVAQLTVLASQPTWKSGRDIRFGLQSSVLRRKLAEEFKLPTELTYRIREYVQYNDQLEWMRALRARMALDLAQTWITQDPNAVNDEGGEWFDEESHTDDSSESWNE